MNVKTRYFIAAAALASSGFAAQAQDNDQKIAEAMEQVWKESHALNTYLGVSTVMANFDELEVAGLNMDAAKREAKATAKKLRASLRTMGKLKSTASKAQKADIQTLQLISNSRLRQLELVLGNPDDSGLFSVSSCTGWWSCFGFQTACEAADGKWEDQGAGVETCTK